MSTQRKPVQTKPETYAKLVQVKGKMQLESGYNIYFDDALSVLASGFLNGTAPAEVIRSLKRKGGKS